MLGASPPQFVLSVGGVGQHYTAPRLSEPPGRSIDEHVAYIPIVLAGGEMSRDSALALYRKLIAPGAAEHEWTRRVAHEDSIRTTQLILHSPEPALDRAVEYAKVNLDESFVCNPDLGCGLVAGYGLSGPASDRPGFGWFFGGDAAINSFAMVSDGQSDLVRDGVFRFFARYQRADGKITHEISQGAGWIDWFGKYPYAFFHGDTSPFWVLAFGEYWRETADTALVREWRRPDGESQSRRWCARSRRPPDRHSLGRLRRRHLGLGARSIRAPGRGHGRACAGRQFSRTSREGTPDDGVAAVDAVPRPVRLRPARGR
jgi:hypothetical protein